ncbi:MAG: flagellar basal body P-ring formation protein FlgA [Alphaproteobacteria bacterium]|nr:flagellar basal body P-ring formation protein FlgA [Alphaproteobacteria bacterium]
MRLAGWLILIGWQMLALGAAAAELSEDRLLQAIKDEFAEQGESENIELEIFGGKTHYEFADAKDVKVLLSDLKIDAGQGRFTVNAEIFADGDLQDKNKIIGRYFVMKEVWVPAKDIAKDAVIMENDLQKSALRGNRLRKEALINQEDIIGREATRLLKAGKPLENGDVRAVRVIKKGQMVTAVYTKKGLQITSKMQALSDAAQGEAVKLLNLSSKKEIAGVAKKSGEVEIVSE